MRFGKDIRSVGGRGLAVAAALALLLSGASAQDGRRTFAFDGHTLTEHRSGADEDIAFVQFAREEPRMREMFAIRSVKKRVVRDELNALVAAIRTDHPSQQLRMFEKSGGDDVMMVYLLTPEKGDPSLVLWRLVQNGSALIAAVYQLDFDVENDEARAKVENHTAELAFSRLDPGELKRLVGRPGKQ